ncbi:MAG: HDIG domain-containing protein [Opitutaceae bacterium]|nr:HDIG domain-containing protein [Opitutaceae bacterium]
MALSDLFRPKANSPVGRRRKRKTETGLGLLQFMERSRAVTTAIFVATVVTIFLVTFVGVNPAAFHILEGQQATARIVAETEFSYPSPLLTQRKRERVAREVPQVYSIDMSGFDQFRRQVLNLEREFERLDATWAALPEADRLSELTILADTINQRSGFHVSVRDLITLMNAEPATREKLIADGLFNLEEIHKGGIFEPDATIAPTEEREMLMFQVQRAGGDMVQTRVLSIEEAATNLRINLTDNLAGQAASSPLTLALFRLLRPGLQANLRHDEARTAALQNKLRAEIQPVLVRVEAGETIIEPGARVTEEQIEKLEAYQRHLESNRQLPTGIDEQTLGRVLLVVGLIIIAGIYLRLEDPMTLTSNSRLGLLALVMLVNLALLRGTLEAGYSSVFRAAPEFSPLLPYMAPIAFAPMVIGVLIGAGPALYSGLLVSVIAAIIFGNRLDLLVLSLLATTIAAYSCRAVRRRSRIVRAGWLSGVVFSIFALLLGLVDRMPPDLAWKAAVGGQVMGLLTGIVVVGMLPVLEALFRRTTDITLLELTDYNHPLLRRMQMEAPGTYHHSLMVANLSENAANAIAANALLCRVCCMFHDIGKLVKPDYFSENQRGGINPHADRSPAFSALIIKSHVKEGVDLAVKHKLPRPVIDVIRQHHGTTLIRYFFTQAREKAKALASADPGAARLLDPNAASESTFRYDGPRPQFKESAIILMADSVEAASRSLQKVTPQAVEELIDGIIREKLDDGQIDDAPLTIKEIALIRRSFTFTLLNSLHARVVYPKAEKAEPASRGGAAPERPAAGAASASTAAAPAQHGSAAPGPRS